MHRQDSSRRGKLLPLQLQLLLESVLLQQLLVLRRHVLLSDEPLLEVREPLLQLLYPCALGSIAPFDLAASSFESSITVSRVGHGGRRVGRCIHSC